MKSRIINSIVAASIALASFVSLGITASATTYNASDLAVGNILVGGTDSIKQNGGTTALIWKSVLQLTYNEADGTQIEFNNSTQDGSSITVKKTDRYQYWRVTSKSDKDLGGRRDYFVTLTANDPYVDAEATTNIWTGEDFPLINVKASAGQVQYSLDEENWSTTVPETDSIGTYTVYYKAIHVDGDKTNNVDSEISSVTSEIIARGAAAGEVKASSVKVGDVFMGGHDAIYQDGGTTSIWGVGSWASLLKLTYKAVDGTQINYTETPDGQSTKVHRSSDARYVYWTVASATKENHDWTRDDYIITLTARDPSVTNAPVSKSLTYTGEPQALVDESAVENGTIYYSLDNETWSTEIPTATEAGEYTVYYKVTGDEGYNSIGVASAITTISQPTPAMAGYQKIGDYGEGSDRASAWNVMVIPGDIAIESINVKVNGKSSKEGEWKDSTVFSGPVLFSVAVNAAAEKITSVTAVVNGEDVVTYPID